MMSALGYTWIAVYVASFLPAARGARATRRR